MSDNIICFLLCLLSASGKISILKIFYTKTRMNLTDNHNYGIDVSGAKATSFSNTGFKDTCQRNYAQSNAC